MEQINEMIGKNTQLISCDSVDLHTLVRGVKGAISSASSVIFDNIDNIDLEEMSVLGQFVSIISMQMHKPVEVVTIDN